MRRKFHDFADYHMYYVEASPSPLFFPSITVLSFLCASLSSLATFDRKWVLMGEVVPNLRLLACSRVQEVERARRL